MVQQKRGDRSSQITKFFAIIAFFLSVAFLMLSLLPRQSTQPKQKNEVLSNWHRISLLLSDESGLSKKVDPEIADEIRFQINSGQLPSSFNNIIKINFDSQVTEYDYSSLVRSLEYLKIAESKESIATALNAILISDEDQLILFLALEELSSKNRIWETSIKIKKNPTTKM